jgi:hypothetical protein
MAEKDSKKMPYQQIMQHMQDGTLRAKTLRLYVAKVKAYILFCEGRPISKETFGAFIWDKSSFGCMPGTVNAYRCALLHFQLQGKHRGSDNRAWAGDEDLVRACRGAGLCHGFLPGQSRGAIDGDMLQHMFDTLARAGTPVALRDQLFFRLIHEGALRKSEFATLQTGALTHTGKHYLIRLETDKRCSAKAKGKHPMVHTRLVTDRFVDVYETLTAGMQKDMILVGTAADATLLRLNAIIKRSAGLCSWTDELKFDGVHCLRHGHAVDNSNNEDLMRRMNCSHKNTLHYSKTNETRIGQKRPRS